MSKVFGKVIISGEHAVVYGELALAAQINLGVNVRVIEGKHEIDPIICRAIEVAGGDRNLGVEIESQIPIGSGLGSSAAVAAAIIKAVRENLRNPIDDDELFGLTMECEQIAHGNPSGIDPAVVVYGGLIAFTKGNPIEKLTIKSPLKLLLIDTGKPEESTKEMVELVASKRGKDKIIPQIGKITLKIKNNLLEGEPVGELINENGFLLEKLGVVGEGAKRLSSELRKLGSSVKITGAGGMKSGSGMMIVMNDNLAKIKQFLDNNKVQYFETSIGENK